MRIAIFGAGGLGGYYGLRLLEAGQEVVFVARGAHKEAIENDGFKLLSPLGDLHVRDVQVTDDPATIGPQDAVLVAVKTWQIPTVAESIGTMLHPETIVVPFLNGVEAPRQLDALLGGGHAAAGEVHVAELRSRRIDRRGDVAPGIGRCRWLGGMRRLQGKIESMLG